MAILKALSSKGFLRAMFWSFLSWLTAWGIAALALPEVKQLFGQYGWLIPAINSFLVLCKQTWDEWVADWKEKHLPK